MKKWLLVLMMFFTFVLAACGEAANVDLEATANSLTFFETPLTENVALPGHIGEVSLTWESSNEALFSSTGVITRPSSEEGDATVRVSVLLSHRSNVLQRTFDVVIRAELDPFEVASEAAFAAIDFGSSPASDTIAWPAHPAEGRFTFTSLTPQWLRNDGFVLSPIASEGVVQAEVLVTYTLAGQEASQTFTVPIAPMTELSLGSPRSMVYESLATEYLVNNTTLNVYSASNGLPYIELLDLLPKLTGAIVYDELTITVNGDLVSVALEVEQDEDFPVPYDEINLTLDFANNTVTFNVFSFFGAIAEATQTDFGAGLTPVDYSVEIFDPVTLDLGFYRLELKREGNQYFIPLHLANQFFTGSMYNIYYNGDVVYGVDTYQLLDGDDVRNTLNNSSLRGNAIPMNLKVMTYHYFAFVMDNFHGLRELYKDVTFYEFLSASNLDFFGSAGAHYESYYQVSASLDDLHTGHLTPGFYSNRSGLTFAQPTYGPRINRWIATFRATDGSFCDTEDNVRFMDEGRVAFISINGFNAETPDKMRGFMSQVDARGTVEDIVLNLACNGGGIIGTAWQVMGHMTDEPLEYYGVNALDGSRTQASYDTDTVAGDYEWFIMMSARTYSAANLVASMAQDMGIAKLIGQPSSGGASSVTIATLPSGSMIQISSNNILANNQHESIELGLPVDATIQLNRFMRFDSDSGTSVLNEAEILRAMDRARD